LVFENNGIAEQFAARERKKAAPREQNVKKRKYYKVQSEPILGKWQHCQNPQMSIFSPPVLSI